MNNFSKLVDNSLLSVIGLQKPVHSSICRLFEATLYCGYILLSKFLHRCLLSENEDFDRFWFITVLRRASLLLNPIKRDNRNVYGHNKIFPHLPEISSPTSSSLRLVPLP